jgi:outer membrane receptor protein involved in Fe transport
MHRNRGLGWILLSGASLAALTTPAFAQGDAEAVSDEIVVTATGRQATIQDVPLAVTAIGGETIEDAGVEDIRDLEQLAPALRIGSGQSTTSGTIARVRGIGTGSDNPGFEAAVGIFIDGVYRSRAGAALADLPELERVEVLRGPQGTLFGRNTSAGAISIITAGPDFEPHAWLQSDFGLDGTDELGSRFGLNVPLGDAFAVRLDGSLRGKDGYITDLVTGDDINNRNRWSGRAQALWDINSDASLRIIADYSQSDEACCGTTPLLYQTTQLAVDGINAAVFGPFAIVQPIDTEGRSMTVTPGLPGLPPLGPGLPGQPPTAPRTYAESTDDWGVSGELNWDMGFANLTSITAYRDWEADRDQDIDFNMIDIAYRDGLFVGFQTFTQEVRLQGEAGMLDWLVGAFYANEELDTTDTIRVGAHTNLYANAITAGATGCELFDSSGGDADGATDPVPSFFFCASGGNPALANVYLAGNTAGNGQQADHWTVETQSVSLFTHNEISFTDQLVLTLGARWNHEEKDLSADLLSVAPSCSSLQGIEIVSDPLIPGPGGLVAAIQSTPSGAQLMNIACNPAINPIANGLWTGASEEDEVTGTASLAFHITPDAMLYGGYSRGYKAGGFNVDRSGFSITPATVNPAALNTDQLHFDPEFVDAYELGLKTTWFGGTTNLNISGFYQEIHDFQSNNFNGFNFITQNVPEVVSRGVEIDLLTRPLDGLSLQGGVVYNDAYYDSTVVFNTADPGPNTINAGDQLTFAPEWSVTGAVTYEVPLGDTLQALFYLDGRWNSEYPTQTLNRAPGGVSDQDAYAVFNGRIGIGNQDDNWAIEFWGRNLTDELVYVGAFAAPLQNTFHIFPSEGRTWGLTLRARY